MRKATKGEMLLVISLIGAALTFWGIRGHENDGQPFSDHKGNRGTAVSRKESSVIEFDEKSSGKKYDAALYLRAKPLRDPFQAERRPEETSRAEADAFKDSASAGKKGGRERVSAIPVLQGIMAFKDNYIAMMEVNGESVTLRRGDRVGEWAVVSIQKKSVDLSGETGSISLQLP